MNDELRREMEEIRSANQQELLNAWAQMEQLADEKDDIYLENEALRNELIASRKREEALMKRLKASEEVGTRRRRSITDGIQGMMEDVLQPSNSKRRLLADKEKIEKEFISKVQNLQEDNEKVIDEWRSKVQCREKVLESLEKTTMIQGESIAKLRIQLEHQTEETKDREESMKQEIEGLAQKVNEKSKVVAKQEKKLRKYRNYIDDLSSELQHLTKGNKALGKKSLDDSAALDNASTIIVKDVKPETNSAPTA